MVDEEVEVPIKKLKNHDYCSQTMVELCKKMGNIKQEFKRLRQMR